MKQRLQNAWRLPALKTLVFTAWIVSLLLTACQADTSLPTQEATPSGSTPIPVESTVVVPTSAPSPTVTPGKPVNLKGQTVDFWHPWQGELARQAQQAVDTFNKTNEWGIQVRIKAWYGEGALQDALLAEKQNPENAADAVALSSAGLAALSDQRQLLVNLDPYIQDRQYGLGEEEVSSFSPAFWAQDQAGGQRLGLPALRSARVIYYNQTWAQELGFSKPPSTPQEFKAQACAAAKKNNTSGLVDKYGTGGWLVDTNALTTLSWLSAFGAKAVPESAGQPYTFESPDGEAAIHFLRGMFDDGCAWLGRNPAPFEYFARRMALFTTASTGDVFTQKRWQDQLASKDQWVLLPFPGLNGKPILFAEGDSYGVVKSDEDAQMAAWLFIRWLSKPETAFSLAQTVPALPVRNEAVQLAASKRSELPWSLVIPLSDPVKGAPALASWLQARRLLEDAAWQVYHLPVEGLEDVLPLTLPQLDEAVKEIAR